MLPTDETIQFTQHSNDVIHSFCIPEFLFKRDVFPLPQGQRPGQRLDDHRIDQEGAFVGRCAELCGSYHSQMNFEVQGDLEGQVRPVAAAAHADQPADRRALHRR